jgi:ATP-dependent DNA helicase RecG
MSNLESIKGIGPKLKEKLNRNRIYDCFDMMTYFPSRYEIYKLTDLQHAPDNERVTLKATVISKPVVLYIRKKLTKLTCKVLIENIEFTVTIFNREYLTNILSVDEEVVLTGTLDRKKLSFTATTLKLLKNFKNEIEPIYNLDGITDQLFLKYVNKSIEEFSYLLQDSLPESLVNKYKLLSYKELIHRVHNPKTDQDLIEVDRRIKYEELFKFQFKMQYIRLKNKVKKNSEKEYDLNKVKLFIKTLPFELTDDQKKATNEIMKDLKSPYCMNRLLQGDTGSGKTVVAAITIYAVLTSGFQVAFMAPTEILSIQHYHLLSEYFKNMDFNVVYLSGKLTSKERAVILEQIATKENTLIVGTHALFSKDVIYKNLGYVITDEQHRFGVSQRQKLREKGIIPDVLYMSATPIPRTLAISLYGDMDLSTIREKPKNRKRVETKLFDEKQMKMVYMLMEEQLRENHQVYIVTPLILESEKLDLSNAQKVFSDIKKHFKEYSVGLMHSKIPQEDKKQVMDMFHDNKLQILVSTTVIEVGVDVPNATLMIIMDSDRFGLSQLHQLRGRIGRSHLQSYCILVYSGNKESKKRLEIMEQTDDGFKLSEADLVLRGPGEFFGVRQSGDMKFLKADIVKDRKIVEIARNDALHILMNNDTYSSTEYKEIYKYLKRVLKHTNID